MGQVEEARAAMEEADQVKVKCSGRKPRTRRTLVARLRRRRLGLSHSTDMAHTLSR